MNTLKKIFVVLLSIISVCFMIVFMLSFSVHEVVIKQARNIVTEEVKKEVLKDVDISESDFNNIASNPETNALIQKYIDLLVSGISGKDVWDDVDITSDIVNFIDNNRDLLKEKLGVTDQQLDEFKNSEDLKKANEYFKENVVQAVSDNTKETVTIFRVYSDLVSTNSKIIFAFLIIVLTGIIALLQKSFAKTIKTFGINLVIGAIFTILFVVALNFIVASVIDLSITVDYSTGLIYGILALVIGIVSIVIGNIYKKKVS